MKFNAPTFAALFVALIIGGIFGYYHHANIMQENPEAAFHAAYDALKRDCEEVGKRLYVITRTEEVEGHLESLIDRMRCVEKRDLPRRSIEQL